MRHNNEFPLLPALGLYAADIRGDGNCLFNALSDQIYGDQSSHAQIRAQVIDYMRVNADYFKQFIDVHPGGGIRRNPKRKSAGAYSTPINVPKPSEEDINRVFETHLTAMSKGGTYGDNMEIMAFCSAFGVDVKIYQRDFAYMITGMKNGSDAERPVAHIAYHMWEHYSSIRNADGPHQGLPNVSPRSLTAEEEIAQEQLLKETPLVQSWQIDLVQTSLNYISDRPTIRKALEATRGNIDAAVSNLLDEQETSSAQESSSVERGHESDADISAGPPKRRASRRSRPRRSAQSRYALANIDGLDGSQDSVGSWESSETSSMYSQAQGVAGASFDSSSSRLNSDSRLNSPARKPVINLVFSSPQQRDAKTLRSHRAGKSLQRQQGPRATMRDRDLKKRAQKAASKELQAIAARPPDPASPGDNIVVRGRPTTDTPPLELRTLYI